MRLLTSSRGPVVPFALTAANLLANARTWSSKRHHQKYEIVEDRKLAYQIVRLMAEEPPDSTAPLRGGRVKLRNEGVTIFISDN